MSKPGINQIPNYLEASTKKRLRSLMRKNSKRLGGYVQYKDFTEQLDGRWVVWYIDELSDDEIIKDQLGMGEEEVDG